MNDRVNNPDNIIKRRSLNAPRQEVPQGAVSRPPVSGERVLKERRSLNPMSGNAPAREQAASPTHRPGEASPRPMGAQPIGARPRPSAQPTLERPMSARASAPLERRAQQQSPHGAANTTAVKRAPAGSGAVRVRRTEPAVPQAPAPVREQPRRQPRELSETEEFMSSVSKGALKPFMEPSRRSSAPRPQPEKARQTVAPLEKARPTVRMAAPRLEEKDAELEAVRDRNTDVQIPGIYRKASSLRVFGGYIEPHIKPYYNAPRLSHDTAAFAVDKELVFRHENKYYINYRDYLVLRNSLKAVMHLDENSGSDGSYHIRSLYFDDMHNNALSDKMAGSDHRYKYRIRIYNFSDKVIRFEKKIKEGQYIAKKSISLTRRDYETLMAGHPEILLSRKEAFAKELYIAFRRARLAPKVIVDYHREAYVMNYERVRITFDKDLRSSHELSNIFDPDLPSIPALEDGMMVLEVKYNNDLPAYIRGVLRSLDAPKRSAVSKYVLCRQFEF